MTSRPSRLSYVLITPARNEEANIEHTIRSVAAQTVPPKKWVVVSDGSGDRTDQIVKGYLREVPWLQLLRTAEHADRQFAAKVHAFNAGRAALRGLDHDIIGNLDADISFEEDYFEFLLSRFEADPRLGVAGTPFVEEGTHYDYRFTSIEHVSGACQLFRRECFEQIGGYTPIEGGGIDWTAVTTARMKGWRTRTFAEKVCQHHRKIGTGGASPLGAWFRQGRKDFVLGGHPLWEAFRGLYQMSRKPRLVGGALLLAGYAWAALSAAPRRVSPELMAFHRGEQLSRLRKLVFRTVD